MREMQLKSNPFPVQWAELVIEFNSFCCCCCSYSSMYWIMWVTLMNGNININDNNKLKCIFVAVAYCLGRWMAVMSSMPFFSSLVYLQSSRTLLSNFSERHKTNNNYERSILLLTRWYSTIPYQLVYDMKTHPQCTISTSIVFGVARCR